MALGLSGPVASEVALVLSEKRRWPEPHSAVRSVGVVLGGLGLSCLGDSKPSELVCSC